MKSSEFEMQNVKTCSVQKVCKKGALQNGENEMLPHSPYDSSAIKCYQWWHWNGMLCLTHDPWWKRLGIYNLRHLPSGFVPLIQVPMHTCSSFFLGFQTHWLNLSLLPLSWFFPESKNHPIFPAFTFPLRRLCCFSSCSTSPLGLLGGATLISTVLFLKWIVSWQFFVNF